jgi:hypothetical protein
MEFEVVVASSREINSKLISFRNKGWRAVGISQGGNDTAYGSSQTVSVLLEREYDPNRRMWD